MLVQLSCPSCNATLRLDEKYLGKKIQCGSCKHTFMATQPTAAEEPLPVEIVEEPAQQGPGTAIQTAENLPKPAPAATTPPRAKGPPKLDLDGSKPARRSARKSSAKSPILVVVLCIALGAIGIAMLGCIVGVGWLFLGKPDEQPIALNKQPVAQNEKKVDGDKDDKGEKKKLDDKNENPPQDVTPIDEKKDKAPFEEKKDKKSSPVEEKKFKDPDPQPVEIKEAPPAAIASIKEAPLMADKEERMLPSPVTDACIGGGGRFFCLYLAGIRKVAIFDVNEAKYVKYLPVPDDNAKIAAGMDKLFITAKGIIIRYSLATFEKEVTAQLPITGQVRALATGSAASGPLLVHYNSGGEVLDNAPVIFIDPRTFKKLNIDVAGGRHSVRDSYHYRASPDGTVFGGWVTSHSQSMSSIVLSGDSAKVFGGDMAGSVVPMSDNTLVTAAGLFTQECKSLGGKTSRYGLHVPAQSGRFYLSCPGGGGAQFNNGDDGKPTKVFIAGDSRPIATLPDVELPASNEAWTSSDYTQDKRVLFVPEAKLIAIVPRSNDRLVLHRFDIDAALAKADVDFFYIVSRPPATAHKGTPFSYSPRAKSRKGGVKARLDSGPEGMKIAADGKLVWNVPKDFAQDQVAVIMTFSDAGGQETFHTFKLRVSDDPPPKVVAVEPAKEPMIEVPAPVRKDPPATAISVATLRGKWQKIEQVSNGKSRDEKLVLRERWLIADDTITFLVDLSTAEREVSKYTYRLDAASNPAELDMTTIKKGTLIRAIVKVDGDRLTVCVGSVATMRARPTSFDSPPGTATTMYVFRRMQPK